MKKFILLSALSFAAFTSAKENVNNSFEIKNEVYKSSQEGKVFRLPYQWVECHSPCGAVYWLQASNYESPADLLDAQQDLNDIKCGN
ncbi:hypothetical protein SAMN05421841_2280 [Chryseobacterium wanjuense]|jgi:hypothetical protein|uniref:Uncharacterized protein n=1 Tax=Chryseobacterium wanjuense TaxID=356305 RepID=A0A1I0QXG4_9FLAO|nr:hypothetical protein [Chryseobacterium wanjuense]SEW32254.1 hypothetical protein SAMN05421841_2280 [Chryseobacterium wanjuense]